MSADAHSEQLVSWLHRWRRQLLEPALDVQGDIARSRASNLALLTLTGAAIQGLLVFTLLLADLGTHSVTGLIALSGVLTLVAYALSRTRYYRAGVLIVLSALFGIACAWTLMNPADTVRVQLLVLPTIAAGYLLPLRAAVVVNSVLVSALTLLVALLVPNSTDALMLNLTFVVGVSAISLVGALAQRRLELRLLRHSAQLTLSERKLRGVIEHSHDGVLLVDTAGTVIEWNAGCERVSGLDREQVIGRPIWVVTAQLHRVHGHGDWPGPDKVRERFLELIEQGTGRWDSRLLENTICAADGTVRTIQSRLFAIPAGGRFMVGGVVRDITDQVRAQAEIVQTAALLRATLDSTAEAILVVNADRELVTYNRQFLELWGLPAYTTCQRLFEHMAAQVQDPEGFRARVAELVANLDIESTDLIALRDGRMIERHATPYRMNGHNAGRVYTYLDVTQRRQAEDALRQSEKRFAIAFQTSPDAVTISRVHDGCYIAVNEGFVSLTGYSADEAVGKTADELQIWVSSSDRNSLVRALRQHSEVRDLEALFRMKNGEQRTGLISARMLELDGEPCILSITRDITERKQLEAQRLALALERERVAMLQRFISDASHDLMTPITVLGTSVYLLNRYATDERQRDHIAKLKVQVDRLSRMIQDMLTMSRLDKPVEDEFEFCHVDLNTIASRIVSDYQGLAEGKGQHLVCKAGSPAAVVNADSTKIEQAVANLVENAIKYTQPGGVISVEVGVEDSRAFLRVHDTGPGIDPRDQPHIFKRFYRGTAHRPSEGGTGLGLSIVRKIVEAHGGAIDVDSRPGNGATFTIWLPLELSRQQSGQP